jgi:hypothetical protein
MSENPHKHIPMTKDDKEEGFECSHCLWNEGHEAGKVEGIEKAIETAKKRLRGIRELSCVKVGDDCPDFCHFHSGYIDERSVNRTETIVPWNKIEDSFIKHLEALHKGGE